MRPFLLALLLFTCSLTVFGQDFEYRKDTSAQSHKFDSFNSYQLDQITTYDIIAALELVDVRIHKLSLPDTAHKQKISITVDEYVDSKLVETVNVFTGDNTYFHFTDSIMINEGMPYIDYLDHVSFYTKQTKDEVLVKFSTYGMSVYKKLKLKTERADQFYHWKRYGTLKWKQGDKTPFLLLGSSWNDGNLERFCAVQDLSLDEKYTQELFDSSSHYFIFSCTISE